MVEELILDLFDTPENITKVLREYLNKVTEDKVSEPLKVTNRTFAFANRISYWSEGLSFLKSGIPYITEEAAFLLASKGWNKEHVKK
jgi:hypothetical protein